MDDLRDNDVGATVALRDGSRVRIRQGRPSDGELVLRGFERLGPESRYRRFLAATPALSREMLRHLMDLDHHDREAMVALDERTGAGVGIARYVRDPRRPAAAEVAVTVIDDWQNRGLGTLLLDVISVRAREESISTFTALVLAENDEMIELLEQLGPLRIVDRAAGTVEIEVTIPEAGVAPALQRLLRVAAQRDVALTRTTER